MKSDSNHRHWLYSSTRNENEAMGTKLFVIGRSNLQNRLLSSYLADKLGVECEFSDEPRVPRKRGDNDGDRMLVLWECAGERFEVFSRQMDSIESGENGLQFALYNIGAQQIRYRHILEKGVRGLFFENDLPDVIVKGINAIMRGELWFTRDPMGNIVVDSTPARKQASDSGNSVLTDREKQILALVASGARNSKIAKELEISPNTVKSHLYNIYKKIDVPSRLQAALWAAKNLE